MIILSHTSAFEYWRSEASAYGLSMPKATWRPNENDSQTQILERIQNSSLVEDGCLSQPLHIIQPQRNHHVTAHGFRLHRPGPLENHKAAYLIQGTVYASSPELCFLQLASILDIQNLILAGSELCSAYRRSAFLPGKLPKCKPATTPQKIERFLRSQAGTRGLAKAQRALRYILPSAASPAELALAHMLSLPYLLGGYGFEGPLLNKKVSVAGSARSMTRKGYFFADLYWPDKKIDIEYDGQEFHSSHEARSNDAERSNALEHMGITVLRVTRNQLFSREKTHALAVFLAKHTGKKLRPPHDFLNNQAALRTRLLGYLNTGRFIQANLYEE